MKLLRVEDIKIEDMQIHEHNISVIENVKGQVIEKIRNIFGKEDTTILGLKFRDNYIVIKMAFNKSIYSEYMDELLKVFKYNSWRITAEPENGTTNNYYEIVLEK